MRKCPRFLLLILAAFGIAGAGAESAGPVRLEPSERWLSLHSGPEDARLWAPFVGLPGQPSFAVALSRGPIGPDLIARIETTGTAVIAYVPDDALLLRADYAAARRIEEFPEIAELKTLPPRVKISRHISSQVVAASASGAASSVQLFVRLADQADGEAAFERLESHALSVGEGIRFLADSGHGARLLATVPAGRALARAEELAADPDVLWIEPAPEFHLLNDAARWVGQNFDSSGAGVEAVVAPLHAHGIRGEGQVAGLIDDGLDPDHKCFWDATQGLISSTGVPNYNQRKVIYYKTYDTTLPWNNCGGEGHGGHTAGTVAGDFDSDGLWDLNTASDPPDGMAPAAKLAICDGGTTDPPGIPADLQPVFLGTYNVGARVHSNSWGTCGGSGCQSYNSASHDVDQFMWEHRDFLLLFSAGNDGPGANTVLPPGTAKNCVTVGATQRGTSANTLASFSSIGPAEDGRRKPTITAPGVNTVSEGSVNHGCNPVIPGGAGHTGRASLSGTSMACPAAAGYATLVRQYFTEGWYPTGAKVAANGFNPSAALLKSMLLSGARKMGTIALPSTSQGWGRISLKEAVYFNDSGLARKLFIDDHRNGMVQGDGAVTYRFNVTASTTPFKVALAWTDAPPAIFSGTKLVNNFNLTAVEPNGTTTYLGSVFNTATGFSQTGGAADALNVEEMVWVQTPALGIWTIRVTPANLPIGPQPYALVVTGDFQMPVAGTPSLDSTLIADPSGPPCVTCNADGAADPGETVELKITLRELGGTAVNGLTGTLSGFGTPGLTITDAGPKAFADLPANGLSFNASRFGVQLSNTVPCGSLIPLRLTLTDGAANTYGLDFGLRAGAPGKTPIVTVIDNFDSTANGSPPNPALWTISGSTAVDNSIVTTASADTGANAVHLLRAGGSIMQTQTLNLSAANTARLTFALWANNILSSASGPFFRVEGCVGPVSTTCAVGSASWQLFWGQPNHFSGATTLNFNSNTMTPPVWSQIALDLTGSALIGASQANVRFRFSQTGSATEASTAAYVDTVNFTAYSYVCSQPAGNRILLMVDKTGGKAHLNWTGGLVPYSVYRRQNGAAQVGPLVTTSAFYDEDVLNDGKDYWWWVE